MKVIEGAKSQTGDGKVKNLNELVTRKEVIEIMEQVVNNINQMGDYLMKDVNTLYANQVFPFQIRAAVIEDILCEQGITTQEEIGKLADERYKKLEEQAKEIKENQEKEAKAVDGDSTVADESDNEKEETEESVD
jgi:hypothetical protein